MESYDDDTRDYVNDGGNGDYNGGGSKEEWGGRPNQGFWNNAIAWGTWKMGGYVHTSYLRIDHGDWDVYSSKNKNSKNLMIILADDADYAESIDRSGLDDSGWDYVISDSFGNTENYIKENYESSHKFDNVYIRAHGFSGSRSTIRIPSSLSNKDQAFTFGLGEDDFIFPGRSSRSYLEGQSLISISSYFSTIQILF